MSVTGAPLRCWHFIDAKGKVLGRLASETAKLLMGKHKPTYDPSKNTGDYVVVVNARHVTLTGNKLDQKVYRRHTGHPGGLKEISVKTVLQKHPDRVISAAVAGMLPKNNLQKDRMYMLRVFPDAEHAHDKEVSEWNSTIDLPEYHSIR